MQKLIFVVCCLLQAVTTAVKADEYSFGVVPQFEVRRLYEIWKPILKVLEQKTGHTFKMRGTESIPEFEKEFMGGQYDFAYMNPWHSLVAFQQQGYQPIVKDGVRKLKGILVANKQADIKNISQLEGKKVVFPAPNALGASLLMRAELKTLHGINIVPSYVGTHSSVYLNVALNQAAAGGGVLRTLKNQNPNIQSLLHIIYETREVYPHPVVAHPRVPKEVVMQVRQAFIEMKENPEQQALLAQIPMSSPVSANIGEYQPLNDLGLDSFYVKD